MRVLAGLGSVVIALALVALGSAPTLAGRDTSPGVNTWAGVWDTDFGDMTLDASGSGSYTGFVPGTITGNADGDLNDGTWEQPGGRRGPFTFRLSADGRSFTGEWFYETGGCGNACGWSGTCISGPCLENEVGGDGQNVPQENPQRNACNNFTDARAAGRQGCTRRVVAGLAPGESGKVAAPIARDAAKTTVTVGGSAGLRRTTIVGEGGTRERLGEAVATCWLLGPEAIATPTNRRLRRLLNDDLLTESWQDVERNPRKAMAFCLALVQVLGDLVVPESAAAGCKARPLAVTERGGVLRVAKGAPPKSAVRYRCRMSAGRATVTVDGRRAGGLRAQLGPKLDMGVVRAPDAGTANAKVTFGFSR
jgi:hypothetical protein